MSCQQLSRRRRPSLPDPRLPMMMRKIPRRKVVPMELAEDKDELVVPLIGSSDFFD